MGDDVISRVEEHLAILASVAYPDDATIDNTVNEMTYGDLRELLALARSNRDVEQSVFDAYLAGYSAARGVACAADLKLTHEYHLAHMGAQEFVDHLTVPEGTGS